MSEFYVMQNPPDWRSQRGCFECDESISERCLDFCLRNSAQMRRVQSLNFSGLANFLSGLSATVRNCNFFSSRVCRNSGVIYCQNAGLKVTNCIFRGTEGGSDLAKSEAGSAKYEMRGCWFSGAKPLDSIVSVDSDNFADSTTASHFFSYFATTNCPAGYHLNLMIGLESISSVTRGCAKVSGDLGPRLLADEASNPSRPRSRPPRRVRACESLQTQARWTHTSETCYVLQDCFFVSQYGPIESLDGGAVYTALDSGTLSVFYCTFYNCVARFGGGALSGRRRSGHGALLH
jgi:hypothetical protein